MPIKNYTTSVSEDKTIGEIVGLLVQKGAKSVQIDYENQTAIGISFVVTVMEVPVPFKLPCDFDGVFKYMMNEYRKPSARRQFERNPESRAQSRRVAWRIIKDWVAAQMALIDAGQAAMAQVFMPYIKYQQEGGITMWDRFLKQLSSQKQLPGAQEDHG